MLRKRQQILINDWENYLLKISDDPQSIEHLFNEMRHYSEFKLTHACLAVNSFIIPDGYGDRYTAISKDLCLANGQREVIINFQMPPQYCYKFLKILFNQWKFHEMILMSKYLESERDCLRIYSPTKLSYFKENYFLWLGHFKRNFKQIKQKRFDSESGSFLALNILFFSLLILSFTFSQFSAFITFAYTYFMFLSPIIYINLDSRINILIKVGLFAILLIPVIIINVQS